MRKLFILIFSIIIVLILGVFTVDTRQNAIVENKLLGKLSVYGTGVHFAPPFISKIVYVYMNQRTNDYEVITDNYRYMFMISWKVLDPIKYYNNLAQKLTVMNNFESWITKNVVLKSDLGDIINKNILANPILLESIGIEIQGIRLMGYNIINNTPSVTPIESFNENNNVQYLESSYYLAQKIKTDADVEAAKQYLSLQKTDSKFYNYYRLLEVYKKSAKSKKDLPLLSEMYK